MLVHRHYRAGMRRLIGLLLLFYSLLLAFNTTVPFIADVAGRPIAAVSTADALDCASAIGLPPFAGFPARCQVNWSSGGVGVDGTVFGLDSGGLANGDTLITVQVDANELPLLTGVAFAPLDGSAQTMAAFLAMPLLYLALHLLFRRRRHRRGGHGSDGDDDSDSDDSDSGGGDGGGDGGD
jgi:hypothetical protein